MDCASDESCRCFRGNFPLAKQMAADTRGTGWTPVPNSSESGRADVTAGGGTVGFVLESTAAQGSVSEQQGLKAQQMSVQKPGPQGIWYLNDHFALGPT